MNINKHRLIVLGVSWTWLAFIWSVCKHFGMLGNMERLLANLAGVYGDGNEGGLGKEPCGAQQVSDALVITLVLLHRLNAHLLFGKQGLVARRVACRRQELEVAMAATQQEANPGNTHLFKTALNWVIAGLCIVSANQLAAFMAQVTEVESVELKHQQSRIARIMNCLALPILQ